MKTFYIVFENETIKEAVSYHPYPFTSLSLAIESATRQQADVPRFRIVDGSFNTVYHGSTFRQ